MVSSRNEYAVILCPSLFLYLMPDLLVLYMFSLNNIDFIVDHNYDQDSVLSHLAILGGQSVASLPLRDGDLDFRQ